MRAPVAPPGYQQLIVDEGIERVTARMTADWLETISALAGLGLAEHEHVSVFGMSMGAPGSGCPSRQNSGRAYGAPSSASSGSARPGRSIRGFAPLT